MYFNFKENLITCLLILNYAIADIKLGFSCRKSLSSYLLSKNLKQVVIPEKLNLNYQKFFR